MKSQNNKRITKNSKQQADLSAINLFAEAGLLKKIKRSGWWVAGIKDPESVADHSFRCAIIAYYMAHLENVDPYKTLTMALFNDIHESRINDLHKMGHYYIDFKEAEKKVFKDQVKDLDPRVKKEMETFRNEYDEQITKESIVARDADILECLLQAKEYYDNGHTKAKKFFKKAPDYLKTKSAQKFWKQIKDWDSGQWWEDVVKFDR
ncbi:MAG: HD domain-containing protein [Candidatus Omnitrophica bacterium]|nr:HD domain-containing protein [Candidatus Omnitrophota bacterium]